MPLFAAELGEERLERCAPTCLRMCLPVSRIAVRVAAAADCAALDSAVAAELLRLRRVEAVAALVGRGRVRGGRSRGDARQRERSKADDDHPFGRRHERPSYVERVLDGPRERQRMLLTDAARVRGVRAARRGWARAFYLLSR
jgi:hypothetical protein